MRVGDLVAQLDVPSRAAGGEQPLEVFDGEDQVILRDAEALLGIFPMGGAKLRLGGHQDQVIDPLGLRRRDHQAELVAKFDQHCDQRVLDQSPVAAELDHVNGPQECFESERGRGNHGPGAQGNRVPMDVVAFHLGETESERHSGVVVTRQG